MFDIYITRQIPDAGLHLLRDSGARIEVNPEDRALTRDEFLAAIRGRDGVLTLLTDRVDAEAMEAAGPRCRVFSNYAVGYNNIDIAEAKKRGIRVTNTPGVLTDATAEMAWALLFAAARRVVESHNYLASGQWKGWGPMQFHGARVSGKTLGIIGPGRIGTSFGLKSIGFDMPILYTSRRANTVLNDRCNAKQVSLDTLLSESDFISIHVPLNEHTHHLIGKTELAKMKSSAILVNTSRGAVIDESALYKALKEKQIAAAGLDVFEHEPRITPGLMALRNVVGCPHTGSGTAEARRLMATTAANNLLAVLQGMEPPHAVV